MHVVYKMVSTVESAKFFPLVKIHRALKTGPFQEMYKLKNPLEKYRNGLRAEKERESESELKTVTKWFTS